MRLFLFPILFLLLSACSSENSCADADGIFVSDTLKKQAAKTGFAYCNILSKALQKDEKALLQLIRFAYKTDDDSAVDHGIVFSEMSVKLGDAYMLGYLSKQLPEHKLLVAKMYDAAMEFGDPKLEIDKKLTRSFVLLMNK
jgi:hypothetical protein